MTNQPTSPTRRSVLAVGAFGVVGAVTGCQAYGNQSAPPAAEGDTDSEGDDGDNVAGENPDENGAATGGTEIASAADIAVGGGLIVADQSVVITQPTAGDFRGFSAVCTHQGCTVGEISDGTINCPCHGSRFSIEDGSVVQAASGLSPDQQDPLPSVSINVEGDSIQAA